MAVLPDYVTEYQFVLGAKSWKHSKNSTRVTSVPAKLRPSSAEAIFRLLLCVSA